VTHPSAEGRLRGERAPKMPTISLKTVYQTLNDLAELGEIQALDLGTGMARFDPNVDGRNHHLVCHECGKVRDLYADLDGLTIGQSDAQGYDAAQRRGGLPGRCEDCRTAEGAGAGASAGSGRRASFPKQQRQQRNERSRDARTEGVKDRGGT